MAVLCGIVAGLYYQFTPHDFWVAFFLQVGGVSLALAVAYFFFEHRALSRQRRIDDLVTSSINGLRVAAEGAVMAIADQWKQNSYKSLESTPPPNVDTYENVSEWVLQIAKERPFEPTDYSPDMDTYGSLHWVFWRFADLASHCARTLRAIGPALMESGALVRAISDLERHILSEKASWEGFWERYKDPNKDLPAEAYYNLLSLGVRISQFIEILNDREHYGDPRYDAANRFRPLVFWRSPEWGMER